jgi:hypothetical protein
MKAKYETFMKFKYFKMMVEKETGQEIGILRTDRRGEFMSHEFKTFCNEQGICRQLTQALIPEQNGVAERRNRTIVEQAHSMISRCKLPTYLWNEAINTANFLVNGSPTSANQGETPERRYIMQKPDVSFLRVFGCFSYLHVPKKNRSKLESKTQKCLIMGYDSNSKAYWVYEPKSQKILTTRDVVFGESKLGNSFLTDTEVPDTIEFPFEPDSILDTDKPSNQEQGTQIPQLSQQVSSSSSLDSTTIIENEESSLPTSNIAFQSSSSLNSPVQPSASESDQRDNQPERKKLRSKLGKKN